MGATFEKRLRKKPVRSRLGISLSGRTLTTRDLRQKLSNSTPARDARSVLKNRRRINTSNVRDARSILRRKTSVTNSAPTKRVPFVLPLKTVRNDLYIQRRPGLQRVPVLQRPVRRYPAARIPDLLSIPTVPPSLLQTGGVNPGRLFTSLVSPTTLPISLPSGDAKPSPIQGFRVEIRNLQPSVSLDDIFELFSSVGTLRLCNLVRPGQAEVVFNEAVDAKEAVRRYNNRELDGRPMNVALVTNIADAAVSTARFASRLGPSVIPGVFDQTSKRYCSFPASMFH
ncbi:unnamed protein product [Dicrocoelium dendriticum]|nr:unnamed protein product [Dicrocoelium dendriticum]